MCTRSTDLDNIHVVLAWLLAMTWFIGYMTVLSYVMGFLELLLPLEMTFESTLFQCLIFTVLLYFDILVVLLWVF